MLCRLDKSVVERIIFPLGEAEDKGSVRETARDAGLDNAEAKDSQEICFIDDDDYVGWLVRNGVPEKPGDFVDMNGNKIGGHKGIIRYTVGQRKGLGVTFGKPMFVTEIDGKTNRVVLGSNEDLMKTEVWASSNFFIMTGDDRLPPGLDGEKITAKIRYAAKPAPGRIYSDGKKVRVVFDAPLRAATPGQTLVYYLGDKVLGGGFILEF